MNDPQPTPTVERWIYGGLRLGTGNHKCHAWSTEGSDHELLFRHKRSGSWAIGGIYLVTVTRDDGKVYLHDPQSATFAGRAGDLTERGRLEAMDLATRTELAAITLQRKAKTDPALDEALQPLLAIAAQLPTQIQVRALIGYVTEKLHSARWRPR
jgi:hypothetical protein